MSVHGFRRSAPASAPHRTAAVLSVAFALAGCAAKVARAPTAGEGAPASGPQVKLGAEAARKLVLNVSGDGAMASSKDWEAFRGEWRSAFAAAAAERSIPLSMQDGAPRAQREPGTLVSVAVRDYRYLTPGARFGLGVLSGNAYIQARVRYLDLATGRVLGEQAVNTSSSAWEGIFSAMTDKQVGAIARETVSDIAAAR